MIEFEAFKRSIDDVQFNSESDCRQLPKIKRSVTCYQQCNPGDHSERVIEFA